MSGRFLESKGTKKTLWYIVIGGIVAFALLYFYILSSHHAKNQTATGNWALDRATSSWGWFNAGDHHTTVVIIFMILIAASAYITAVLGEMVAFFVGGFTVFMIGYTLPAVLSALSDHLSATPKLHEQIGGETAKFGLAFLAVWSFVYLLREVWEALPHPRKVHVE